MYQNIMYQKTLKRNVSHVTKNLLLKCSAKNTFSKRKHNLNAAISIVENRIVSFLFTFFISIAYRHLPNTIPMMYSPTLAGGKTYCVYSILVLRNTKQNTTINAKRKATIKIKAKNRINYLWIP